MTLAYRPVTADAAGARWASMSGAWSTVSWSRPPTDPGQSLRITGAGFHGGEPTPRSFVLIEAELRIQITGESAERRTVKISYEDIGGLGKTIARIREMIELPLRFPRGVRPARHKPAAGSPALRLTRMRKNADRPGGGERDRRALSASTGPRSSTSSTGKARLTCDGSSRSTGARADLHLPRREDAIAPKRTEVQGEVEKRVVAQLLALDGRAENPRSGDRDRGDQTSSRISIRPCVRPSSTGMRSIGASRDVPAAARS